MGERSKSDLVFNAEGKLYHININPGDVAENIILVGDPARAKMVASQFDKTEFEGNNREIRVFTGFYGGTRISAVSTGMGTDNIEIVVTELDALFNIDLKTGKSKESLTRLNLIRIGTSGALQADIPVCDSFLASTYAIGLDGLAYFYKNGPFFMEREMTSVFINQTDWDRDLPKPYAVKGSDLLLDKICRSIPKGITLTAPGFYAPQGREVRLSVADSTIIDRARKFKFNGYRVCNFEMETSALYILANMLNHHALTVCDIIANRITGEFDPHYQSSMQHLIRMVLDGISEV